jgi:hypothetical protein
MPRPVRHATGASSNRGIFKPEHQSKCPPTEDKPRIFYINPLQQPNGVWAGSIQYTDFEIDQNIGVCQSLNLRNSITFSDPAHLPSCSATFYSIQRVEIYFGADLVETVFADTLYHESLAFARPQDAINIADVHNVNEQDLSARNMYFPTTALLQAYATEFGLAVPATGVGYEEALQGLGNPVLQPQPGVVPASLVLATSSNAPVDGQITKTASGFSYVNLDNTCLKAGKFYIKGFNSRIKVRVYWQTSWASQQQLLTQYVAAVPGSAGPPVVPAVPAVPATFRSSTPTLASTQLLVEEQTTDAGSLMALEQAHRAGIVDYTIMVRERLQDSPPSFTGGAPNITFLRAFRNKSAGIVFYLTNPNPPADRLQQRLAFATMQLLDSRGNKLTEVLDNDLLTSKVFPDQIDSSFPNSANAQIRTVALLPFSKHFEETYKNGCSMGSYQLTTLEQFVLTVDGTNATQAGTVNPNGETTGAGVNMLTLISYSYAHITCMGGNHSIRFE